MSFLRELSVWTLDSCTQISVYLGEVEKYSGSYFIFEHEHKHVYEKFELLSATQERDGRFTFILKEM